MADAEAEAEAVRAAATEVMLLDYEGHNSEALDRARDLMLAHPGLAVTHRLLGELQYAAATRAVLGGGDDHATSAEEKQAAAAAHLRVARDALEAARRLAPDCVDVAAALGDAYAASRMYRDAEREFIRARDRDRIRRPTDPALHNVSYGMLEGYAEHERDPEFAGERVEEARSRAAASYARMTVEELVPVAVRRVLETGTLLGAAEGRKRARVVAETFPNLARAQHLAAYMDLEFVRGLDAAAIADRRPFLRRTLAAAGRAAREYPKSAVIAAFHAKLLFVLGEYDAAEAECRRALDMKEPDDPQKDCIPLGSISGDNRGARLVSLACEFHELINRILVLASDYWDSISEARRHSFLQVRLDALQDEYRKVDWSYAFTMSDVRSFVKEHGCWRFWVCPLCDRKKFLDTGLLLSHLCSRHPRAVLPRLQSVVDQKLCDEALASDDSLDGVTFSEDSEQKDMMICFSKSSEVFKWMFYAPSSGVRPKPFPEMRENKCEKGRMLLESIKDKMKTLPADRSSTEFTNAIPEIQEVWHKFLKSSVLDYREVILELARSLLWRELKKHMTEDPQLGAKSINAADIDAIFTKEAVNPASNASEVLGSKSSDAAEDQGTQDNKQSSQAEGAPMVRGDHQESYVHDEGENSEKPPKNTELSDQTITTAGSGSDLAAKLDKLEIDPKITLDNKESDVQLQGETSEASVTGTELENMQTDPRSDSSVAASDAGSSGQHQQE